MDSCGAEKQFEIKTTRGSNSYENGLPSIYFERSPQLLDSVENEYLPPIITSEDKPATIRMKETIAIYKKAIKDRDEEIKEKSVIINNQQQEIRKIQNDLFDVWSKYNERNSVISSQDNTINRLNNQLDTQTLVIKNMMQESQDLKETIRKSSEAYDLLEKENNSLKNEIRRSEIRTADHLKSIEEYRTNIHQLNQIISCIQNENETLSIENRNIIDYSFKIEKDLEMYTQEAEHLSTENFKLNSLVMNKDEIRPGLIYHSTASDLNDFVKVRDEKPVSWTKIFKAFSKTSKR